MPDSVDRRPHLLLSVPAEAIPYGSHGFPASRKLPPRDRQAHGQRLITQLTQLGPVASAREAEQRQFGLMAGRGLLIQFISEPGFGLEIQRLELRAHGIELYSLVERDDQWIATVFVPEGKLRVFLEKVEQYLTALTKKGAPRNQSLVDPISGIREAVLEAMWTDPLESFPAPGAAIWWEAWFRKSDQEDHIAFLRQHAGALELRVGDQTIDFVERRVVLVFGTREQLSRSLHLLTGLAEVRAARETAAFFTSLTGPEQAEWVADAAARLTPPGPESPAVCILDSGLNKAHPLLAPVTKAQLSVDAAWGVSDHQGHGTEMAGIAAFGDLANVLPGIEPLRPPFFVESCKILPPQGPNDPQLYGAITRSAVSSVEIEASGRRRVFQMAVTADAPNTGRPSSWSGAIDAITSGAEDDQRRLFVLAVGNVRWNTTCGYPAEAEASGCEDPSQAWNALAVGGVTGKTTIDPKTWPEDEPLAPHGALCPESRTSLTWSDRWPYRPDIVLEAGNLSVNKTTGYASDLDDLALLTTGHEPLTRPLVVTRGTSPGSAQAAGLAAELMAAYPQFWPETVRGLLVHASDWTPAMWNSATGLTGKKQYRYLLRTCGWGVPNRERLLHSASNSLTLVVQDVLNPFRRVKGVVGYRDMHLHALPWPKEALEDLFDAEVELRVTLSYFIEPSPGERGYGGPFTYASHGLRFALQQAGESDDDFKKRVNLAARDEEDDGTYLGDSEGWQVGPKSRNRGSLVSDRWKGTAADLAGRRHVAVYPISGWWRYRAHLERYDRKARYALIVSIHAPEVTVDLYAEIEQRIAVTVSIQT